tara:strand:+ start:593 stop:844 length:252 start_codon:yes stop_codon:yes gene_type:complete
MDKANYENNFIILAEYLIALGKKNPKNKHINNCQKALKEMYFFTNTLQIDNRELLKDNSDIKQDYRDQQQEFYNFKTNVKQII